jgi:hypothetical protein
VRTVVWDDSLNYRVTWITADVPLPELVKAAEVEAECEATP